MSDSLMIFVKWEQVIHRIMDRTSRFPKNLRYPLAKMIEEKAIHILIQLSEYRYTPHQDKLAMIKVSDLHLSTLKVLLRLAHHRIF